MMKATRNILFIATMAFTLFTNNAGAKETELIVASSHENIEENYFRT